MSNSFAEQDFYERLSISRDATRKQIVKAYRELAAVYHPDSGLYSDQDDTGLKDEHVEIFKLITEAYNTLTNANKRMAYDASLPAVATEGDAWKKVERTEAPRNPGSRSGVEGGLKANVDLSKLRNQHVPPQEEMLRKGSLQFETSQLNTLVEAEGRRSILQSHIKTILFCILGVGAFLLLLLILFI